METNNKRTCLYDSHVALGAQISPFGGFDMPIQYSDIISEHNAVRHNCGIFDVSHMGEVRITGVDSEKYVQHIFTNDVSTMTIGKIQYGMMLYSDGGVVDDLLVYKMGENDFFLVINAANIAKDLEWMNQNSKGFDISIEDLCDKTGQIAVQGPQSENVVESVLDLSVRDLEFYTFKTFEINNEMVIVSRTGYTGEDGFEIYGSHAYIKEIWEKLINSKKVMPCGLGARDTLRFEVGLPLYGNELSKDISPIEAGLGTFVKTGKEDFIGRDAILKQKENGVPYKIVGLELDDRAIPRHGYDVLCNDKVVGHVTTGYSSISTGKSVAMALVESGCSAKGERLKVKIHRKLHDATVIKKKFYNKNYKK
ncbi:MAG: glycine cleavage system aminomethyltransferase GcvT [Prevotellaceae bacterium]|nr:glycine cleavage system aminomethyltransferase GcvT [Prevotellaceae bacterium]